MANLSSLIAPSGVLTAGADISELTNDAGYASQSDIDTSIANLAEGASGAPGIVGSAFCRDDGKTLPVVTVAAGNIESQQGAGFSGEAVVSNSSSTDVVVCSYTIKSYTGVLRISGSFYRNSGFNSTGQFSLYKNNILVQSYTQSSSTPLSVQNDVAIVPEDVLEWRIKTFNPPHAFAGQGFRAKADNPYVEQIGYRLNEVSS